MRKTVIILNIMNGFLQIFSAVFYIFIFVNALGTDITDSRWLEQLMTQNFLFTLFLFLWILLGIVIFGMGIASLICCTKLSSNEKGRKLGILASVLAITTFIFAYIPFFNFSLQLIIIITFWVSAAIMLNNKEIEEVE